MILLQGSPFRIYRNSSSEYECYLNSKSVNFYILTSKYNDILKTGKCFEITSYKGYHYYIYLTRIVSDFFYTPVRGLIAISLDSLDNKSDLLTILYDCHKFNQYYLIQNNPYIRFQPI